MCQITLQVPDQQYEFFRELVRNLKFVKVKQESPLNAHLTPSQKKTWKNSKQGFEELKPVEEGNMNTRSLKQVLNGL